MLTKLDKAAQQQLSAWHQSLMTATKQGNIAEATQILDECTSAGLLQHLLIAQESKSFYLACLSGSREMVQLFLAKATDVEQNEAPLPNRQGCLSTMLLSRFSRGLESAAGNGHLGIVQDILAAAEQVNCTKELLLAKFAGAATIAAAEGRIQVLNALLDAGEKHGALPEMLMTGHAAVLSACAEKNRVDSARLLLEKAETLDLASAMLITGSGHGYREAVNHHHEGLQKLLLETARKFPQSSIAGESTETAMLLGAYAFATQSSKHPERQEMILELLREAQNAPALSHEDVAEQLESRMLRIFAQTRNVSEDTIRQWWQSPSRQTLTLKEYQTAGLELECYGLTAAEEDVFGPFIKQRFGWSSTLDKSIRNSPGTVQTEFVSPIITPEKVADSLSAVALIERLGEVNDSCALHVHLGMRDNIPDVKERLETIKQLAINYTVLERAINRAVGDSPCVHHYEDVREAADGHLSQVVNQLKNAVSIDQVVDILRPDSKIESLEFDNYTYTLQRRRSKLNIKEPMSEHGTTEFRHHPGMLKATHVLGWGQFCLDMQDSAREMAQNGAHVPSSEELLTLNRMVQELRANQQRAALQERLAQQADGSWQETIFSSRVNQYSQAL